MTESVDHPETAFLAAGVATLREPFLSRGFTYEADATGFSSGGPFLQPVISEGGISRSD